MHRRHRRPSHRPAHLQPSHKARGLGLSAATFVAGIAAAVVMIGANADEPDMAPGQGIGTAHVALSIGR
ncbi:hypothetical protein [uncultured Aquincola sp.]|uniref:hypothetical protein n=1 Tax=uncultured Aquincola sp. TaxID=886556 RepID=UPI0032B1ABC7